METFSMDSYKILHISAKDYCVRGLLNRTLSKRKHTTIHELWKLVEEEQKTSEKPFWKLCCNFVVEKQGYENEYLKSSRYTLNVN